MKKLTQKRKKAYVKNGGVKCPYCKAETTLEGGFIEVDAGGCWQAISCPSCGKRWTDVYKLVDIEEDFYTGRVNR